MFIILTESVEYFLKAKYLKASLDYRLFLPEARDPAHLSLLNFVCIYFKGATLEEMWYVKNYTSVQYLWVIFGSGSFVRWGCINNSSYRVGANP